MSIVKETMEFVKSKDEEIGAALEREYKRQKDRLYQQNGEHILILYENMDSNNN